MHFLTDPLVALALHHFDHLDSASGSWIERGDWFFSTFGPGNVAGAVDRPHERFSDYEALLLLLKKRNERTYAMVHKGTPFFFLAWLAFDLRNHEKCLYYLDAAISEDVKNMHDKWPDLPGAHFLRLSTQPHVASGPIQEIRGILGGQIERFNAISGGNPLTIDAFVTKFINPLIQGTSSRTIASAFYVFLLESRERLRELGLKSTEGTSLGPIISSLFGGSLIFESLLKFLYPKTDAGDGTKTIGQIFFQSSAFRADFGGGLTTSATTLAEVLAAVTDDSAATALSTTAKLRNTTGHNLVWDDVFRGPREFEILFQQIMNALLFVVERKFL